MRRSELIAAEAVAMTERGKKEEELSGGREVACVTRGRILLFAGQKFFLLPFSASHPPHEVLPTKNKAKAEYVVLALLI